MALQLLLSALENPENPKLQFSVQEFNLIWEKSGEEVRQRLKQAVFEMLKGWGLIASKEGCAETRSKESEKRQNFIRKYVFPLKLWQTPDGQNWREFQDLAKARAIEVMKEICDVRNRMLEEKPEDATAMKEYVSFDKIHPTLVSSIAGLML